MANKETKKICKNCWYAKLLFNLYHCDIEQKPKHAEETCKTWAKRYEPSNDEPRRCPDCHDYACSCYL